MRVGHFQCECRAGDYEANLAKVLRGMEYAEENRVQVMTFPDGFFLAEVPIGAGDAYAHRSLVRARRLGPALRRAVASMI